MSTTTFYLSAEDTREFNRLVALENELYKIQYVNLEYQWYLLARDMFNLAWKCAPAQIFNALLTGTSTPFRQGETLNEKAYGRLKILVQPFVKQAAMSFC